MMTATADAQTLRSRWGWIFGAGVILAILGVLALMNAVNATLITTAVVGLIMIVAGVVDIFAALTGSRESGGWRLLRGALGIIYIVVGIELWADPLRGAIALTVVVGILLFIEGAIRIFQAFANRQGSLLLGIVIGVLDLILGAWVLSGIPFSGVAIGFFVGLMLLMGGISWMVAGWSLKSGALP